MLEERPNYYAIIPASVRYDSSLKPNEKLLYGEITALSNKTGECYATNSYFAELYGVENETISRWIKNLKARSYINTKIIYKETKEIEKRIIVVNGVPIDEKINTYIPNNQEGIDEKVKENNTSINNKKKIYKRKDFVPPTLEEIQNYCEERKNNVNAKKFYDYYSTNGWRDSNDKPIKNWKLKIINWESDNPQNTQNYQNSSSSIPEGYIIGKVYEENGVKFRFSATGKREIL